MPEFTIIMAVEMDSRTSETLFRPASETQAAALATARMKNWNLRGKGRGEGGWGIEHRAGVENVENVLTEADRS